MPARGIFFVKSGAAMFQLVASRILCVFWSWFKAFPKKEAQYGSRWWRAEHPILNSKIKVTHPANPNPVGWARERANRGGHGWHSSHIPFQLLHHHERNGFQMVSAKERDSLTKPLRLNTQRDATGHTRGNKEHPFHRRSSPWGKWSWMVRAKVVGWIRNNTVLVFLHNNPTPISTVMGF